MITREEAIQATNLIFEFCCQQKDCKSCPFCGERIFVPEQGYITCGLYEEPCAWNRVWNGDEKKMTNLEVLRQELKEFIDKASEADLMKVVLDSGREICDCCAYNYMLCGQECIHGFIAWGQQEYKEPEDETALYVCGGDCEDKLIKLLEGLQVHRGATVESLLKDGFTNYSEPILHKSWRIKLKDKYPVSFVMDIAKKTLKISEVIVFDECFGQPHPCGKEEYMQIEQIVNELVNKKILERCKE